MLKRMTRITSLLVCAASIVSIIPAFAADVKKYDADEGTVYSAKAKGAGIYIDGEINDKDEAQYFITPDGKYNEIDGIDAGMAVDDLLLGQYLIMDDGDTVVDIKDNYKIVDDKTRADLQDDLVTTLRKKVKADNDDRFSDADKQITSTSKFLDGASGLSMYKYTLKSTGVSTKTTDAVYADYAGNYVDADYNLGSVKVTTTGGSITFKNTDDTYELKEGSTTYEYKAVIEDSSYITVISDNVYRWANLSIYKKVKGAADSTYSNVTDQVGFGTKGYSSFVSDGDTSVSVLQRFSKTVASDDIGGIKYSKDAATYFVADDSGKSEVVLGKSTSASASKLGAATGGITKITGNAQGFCSAYLDVTNKKVYAQQLTLKSKDGFNYIDLGDTDNAGADDASAVFTSGGFVWTLDGGYVKAWDGNDSFAKVYKVDGDFNRISVGSKDIIALWNEDDSLYTVINNTSKTTTTDTTTGTTTTTGTATTTNVATGWVKAVDGTWSYNKADGTKATGWIQDGSTWYYLNASGVMQTGWVNDNGTWYYCNTSGAMLANTTVDGYVLGDNGAWVK